MTVLLELGDLHAHHLSSSSEALTCLFLKLPARARSSVPPNWVIDLPGLFIFRFE